jgi:hypothetical protein
MGGAGWPPPASIPPPTPLLNPPSARWAYDIGSGSLTRVLSTPYGGGVGGVSYASGIGNFDYVFASVMHPYRGHESRASSPLSVGQVGAAAGKAAACCPLLAWAAARPAPGPTATVMQTPRSPDLLQALRRPPPPQNSPLHLATHGSSLHPRTPRPCPEQPTHRVPRPPPTPQTRRRWAWWATWAPSRGPAPRR